MDIIALIAFFSLLAIVGISWRINKGYDFKEESVKRRYGV